VLKKEKKSESENKMKKVVKLKSALFIQHIYQSRPDLVLHAGLMLMKLIHILFQSNAFPIVLNMSLNKTKILIMIAIKKTLKTILRTRNEKTAIYCKLFGAISVLLNTAKNTRDPIAIRVRVRAAYLSSVIVIMSLEAK